MLGANFLKTYAVSRAVGSRVNNTSHSQKSGFVNWLKTNWFFVLAVLIILPLIYRYLKDQIQLNKIQNEELKGENQLINVVDPVKREKQSNAITTDKGVQNAAADLAHHLGTKYSDAGNWYDIFNPRGWTENDKKVMEILKYQVRNFHLVERLYFEVYSKRRNLKDDVNKLLDSTELTELKQYYKKYGKIW